MEYTGEHLLAGQLGQSALWISLITAIVATVLFFLANGKRKMIIGASSAYLLHTAGILSACAALLVMIFNHYFEYHYVWQYTSVGTSVTYLLSAFWAGKEGSLLLWLMLQALLGTVLMFRKNTPSTVLAIIAFADILLNIMLLGLHAGDINFGNSPFALLREVPEYSSMPLFSNQNYLSILIDGNGLNPLLRNPWMAIHPPILFLGYAACLIPYSFSINALIKREARPMMPLFWPVFAAMCLGAGLILGGAWAYEDLTFGGFWSWDPVENASLVPWILMLASLHFLLAPGSRSTGLAFSITPYVAVLFAAYLTRSGVLSTTSVHSFSGGQGSMMLLLFTMIALIAPLLLTVIKKKEKNATIENLRSTGLWMFIGAAVLVLAAFQVIFVTTLPAFNAWFGLSLTPPSDAVTFYNTWQQWFAAAIALSIGIVCYIDPQSPNFRTFVHRALPALVFAPLLIVLLIIFLEPLHWNLYIVLCCLFFGGFSVLDSILRLNGRKGNIAASITHLGFAIFIIGVCITFSLSTPIGSADAKNPKGLQTLILGQIKALPQGYVSYAGRTINGDDVIYKLDFLKKASDGKFYLDYTLYPSITVDKSMGTMPKPDTRKRISEDIFVHLTHAEITTEEYGLLSSGKIAIGDTLQSTGGWVVLDSMTESKPVTTDNNIMQFNAYCRYIIGGRPSLNMNTSLGLNHGNESRHDAVNDSIGIKLSLAYPVSEDTAMLELSARKTDFVVMSAQRFPFINILWFGVILMAIGFGISVIKRLKR